MATAIPCQQCAKKDTSEAELFCIDCGINLCHQCVQSHVKIPLLQNHKFRSCTAQGHVESDEKHKENKLMDLIQEKVLKNINNETSPEHKANKILASQTTLEKMVTVMQLENKRDNIRHIKGSFTQIITSAKHVKSVHKLIGGPYRLGYVNDQIWLRCADGGQPMKIAVYDRDLCKIKEIQHKDETEINVVQQVNQTDVFVGTDDGLYVFNIDGEFLYRALDDVISDIMVGNDKITVIDHEKNKIITVTNRNNKWQKYEQSSVDISDTKIKTIHEMNDYIFVCANWQRIMYKYNSTGQLVGTFGTGERGRKLGEFDGPLVCGSDDSGDLIVADSNNDRFQILNPQGLWQEIKLSGIKAPVDVLVVDRDIFIFHREFVESNRLSKYTLPKL